ncbi:unnamed protein product [Fusarium graminearum]|nr:unnamed protein product [Fusarium graminearum]
MHGRFSAKALTLKEIDSQHQRQDNHVNPLKNTRIIFRRNFDPSLRRDTKPSHQICSWSFNLAVASASRDAFFSVYHVKKSMVIAG